MSSIAYDPSAAALLNPELRETVFEFGREYSPLQLAMESARLAYVRFDESTEQAERLTAALARTGFGAPVPFIDKDTDSQGFGAYRRADDTALVSFRGTQPDKLKDLLSDLMAAPVLWRESGGLVHHGFASRARSLIPQVRTWLETQARTRASLVMAGHSLGAALATLVATVCRPNQLVTIGSPRVGNAEFKRGFPTIGYTRIVDCCDEVTELPPELGIYTHICRALYITRDGTTLENPASTFMQSDRERAQLEYALHEGLRPGAVPLRGLADHAPINYLRAFF